MFQLRSIAARLMFAVSLTVGAACGILGTFSIVQERALTRLALDQQLKLQYDSVIAALDYEGRAALAVSAVIATLPPVADAVAKGDRDALLALLDKIGPSILLTHSQAGAFGWPVADARPDLVKAILAIEPNGPPFYQVEFKGGPDWFKQGTLALPYGITAVPLNYAPPIKDTSDLKMVQQDKADAPDFVRCYAQAEPARQLPNLQKMPILVLTAEASYHAPYDHCTVNYLRQAGVKPTYIRLADIGIKGNSHVMMLEKNNKDIAAVIAKWLDEALKE